MFYETKIIKGILHYRNSPNEEFKKFTDVELTEQLTRETRRADNAETQLKGIALNIAHQFPEVAEQL